MIDPRADFTVLELQALLEAARDRFQRSPSLSLLSALVVLPPLLIWFDEEAGLVPVEEKKLHPAE